MLVQEEEAARLAAEEEARRAEDAERRKAERLARRAEAKRAGLILTGRAKREADRLAAMREQILKNAAAAGDGASSAAAANGAQPAVSPCLCHYHAACPMRMSSRPACSSHASHGVGDDERGGRCSQLTCKHWVACPTRLLSW